MFRPQEHLDKPRERGPDGEVSRTDVSLSRMAARRPAEELADSKALRRKLQSDKEELEKQMALQEQHQSLRAEQQQRVVQRLGDQLQVLLGLLDGLRVKPVMTASGRQELKQARVTHLQCTLCSEFDYVSADGSHDCLTSSALHTLALETAICPRIILQTAWSHEVSTQCPKYRD